MNFKDKLIKRLVEIGKKHRILVYPTLALIAIISAASNAMYWGRNNRKRMLASILVMVLLITQSMFLTSSADETVSETSQAESSATTTAAPVVDSQPSGDNSGTTTTAAVVSDGSETTTTAAVVSGDSETTTTAVTTTTAAVVSDGSGDADSKDQEQGNGDDNPSDSGTGNGANNSNDPGTDTEGNDGGETAKDTVVAIISTPFVINVNVSLAGTKISGSYDSQEYVRTVTVTKNADGDKTTEITYSENSSPVALETILAVDNSSAAVSLFSGGVDNGNVAYEGLYWSASRDTLATEENLLNGNFKTYETYTENSDGTPVYNSNNEIKINAYAKATVKFVDVTYTGEVYNNGTRITDFNISGSAKKEVTTASGTNGYSINLTTADVTDFYKDIGSEYIDFLTLGGIKSGSSSLTTELNSTSPEPVSVNPGDLSLEVTTVWNSKSVSYTYDPVTSEDETRLAGKVSESSSRSKTGTFYVFSTVGVDGVDGFPDPIEKGWATTNDGYGFTGWKCSLDNKTYQPGDSVTVYDLLGGTYSDSVTFNGGWKYKDFALVGLSGSAEGYTINGTYATNISCDKIGANYSGVEDIGTNFYIYMSDDDEQWLKDMGVTITKSSSSREYDGKTYYNTYSLAGKVTGVGTKTLKIYAYDTNKSVSDDGSPVSSPFNVTVTFSKLDVTIKADSIVDVNNSKIPPTKTYDGTSNINLLGYADVEVSSTSGVDTDTITNDAVKVLFDQSANFNDENAGTKNLLLTNVKLDESNPKAGNYNLIVNTDDDGKVIVEGRGIINKCPISITVKVKDSDQSLGTVKFGVSEGSDGYPSYELAIDDANLANLAAVDKDVYDDNPASFYSSKLGFSGNFNVIIKDGTTKKSTYSPAGTYIVTPVFDTTNIKDNYQVTVATSGTLVVERDEVTADDYAISGKVSSDGYYGDDVVISATGATGGYDRIRLCSGTDDDVTSGSSVDDVRKLFADKNITYSKLSDMTGGKIYVQLYNSTTGAVSRIGTISDFSFDVTGPKLESYNVTPFATINALDFGYYHKSDADAKVIKLTFTYSSENSECEYLYYYFVDSSGKKIEDKEASVKLTGSGNGPYTASMSISTDTYGQVVVYAKDKAGNSSVKQRIYIKNAEKLFEEAKTDQDYYEWMVENTQPEAEISVYQGSKGSTLASTGEIYSTIRAVVDANDAITPESNGGINSGINRVEWKVIDASSEEELYTTTTTVSDTSAKRLNDTFSISFPAGDVTSYSGNVYISATVYDNAGNETVVESSIYSIDSVPPDVKDLTEDAETAYVTGSNIKFEVSEDEKESGIDKVVLYQKNGKNWSTCYAWDDLGGIDYIECEYTIEKNGEYKAKAVDCAGNESEELTWTFKNISTEKPDAPTFKITGQTDSEWYTSAVPKITIEANNKKGSGSKPITNTDKTPIHTEYTVKVNGENVGTTESFEAMTHDYTPDVQGELEITAVNISASGVKSDEATTSLKIDTVKPVVSITGSKINDQGKLVLEFEVTDETSGVDLLGVTVNDNLNVVSRPDDSGAVTGTFTVDEDKTYTIKAKDKAGNESEPVVFVPLTLSVSPVTDITDSSAYVEAEINAGTYDIKSYYIAYKKSSSSRYTVCRTVKDETTETGVKLSCDFKNLSSDTSYDFKVYAVAETTGETKSYEGTFKTLDSSATGEVYGSAKYEDTFSEDYRTYPIYVTLTSGDSVIAGATLDADSDGKYSFKNVSDGEYQVNAVAGNYSKTARVVVSDGYVTYPESYLATGGIAFEIGGLSTSVEIQNDTGITAENLEAVFVKGYGNNDNVSDAEYKDVEAGGNILITLYAESLDTSSGEYADAIDYIDEAINDKMDGRGKPVRYYDIYLTKTYTSSTGEKTVSNISSLTEPITMFFTDESLVGKPMYVVAVSEDSLYGGFSEPDIWPKDGPSFNGIVQVDTYHCSVYAIYTDEAYVKKQYTVTWYGGDNQVLKSETVTEGDSVTAPVGVTPTKTSDVEGYHYEFVGWKGAPDIFKNITADTDIDADFKLVADSASGGSTETPDNTASGGSTEKPDNTASGGTTEKPNNTASGGTTEKPNNTASGGTTEKPNNTASGGTTEKPGSTTQSPSNTASGGTTEKPGNTSTGNNGSGSTTETPGITGSTSTGNDSSGSQNPGGNTTVGGSGNGSITEIPGASTEQPTTQSPANADGTVIIIQNPTNTSVPDTYITIPAGSDSSDTGIDVSATGTHYSYMGSSSSPKTGDSTPIAVIVVLMLTSATGLVVITRKRKEEQ